MKHTLEANWQGNMAFEADINGHKVTVDTIPENGGNDSGPTPKILMLYALAGCTGMDVVSILKKMRVDFDDLKVSVEGELTDENPKYYKSMHVIYKVYGKNIPLEKVQKAVSLSEETYCGVGALYKKAITVTSEIQLIE